jgi:hypothetical protein
LFLWYVHDPYLLFFTHLISIASTAYRACVPYEQPRNHLHQNACKTP